MRALILIFLLLSTSVVALPPGDPGFRGCVIGTGSGGIPDADCDRAPDPLDNCPLAPNPDQLDRDQNGIGDACDLIIDEISVEPQPLVQGRSMVVSIYLTNNRAYPMRNLIVKTEAPGLGVAQNEDLSVIAPGERLQKELVMKVPDCAKLAPVDIVAIAEYPFAPGQKEVFSHVVRSHVIDGGACSGGEGGGPQRSVVDIAELQDVTASGAVYPFKIYNSEGESKAYILTVDGLYDWGYASIEPGAVIVVPAGTEREGAVRVWAYEGVEGKFPFTFTVQSRNDIENVVLTAQVHDHTAPDTPIGGQLVFGIAAFLILLVAAGALLLYFAKGKFK